MRMRRAMVGLALIAALGLSGCSNTPDGWVGIAKRSDGSLWVLVRTCHEPVGGALVDWPDDPNGADSNEEVFARWTVASPARSTELTWRLLGAPTTPGVIPSRSMAKLPSRPKNMSIDAWTADSGYVAWGPDEVTAGDLAKLPAGGVLILNDLATQDSDPVNRVITQAQFAALDCARFGQP